jgi:hypothetical protein
LKTTYELPCWNCNSRGTTHIIKNTTNDLVSVFLFCRICRQRKIVRISTKREERLRTDIEGLIKKIKKYHNPSNHLRKILEKKLNQLGKGKWNV